MAEPTRPMELMTTLRETVLAVTPDGEAVVIRVDKADDVRGLLRHLSLDDAELLEGPVLLDRQRGSVSAGHGVDSVPNPESLQSKAEREDEAHPTAGDPEPPRWFSPRLVVVADPDRPHAVATVPMGVAETVSSLMTYAYASDMLDCFMDVGWIASQVPTIRTVEPDEDPDAASGPWSDRAADAGSRTGRPTQWEVTEGRDPESPAWVHPHPMTAVMEFTDGMVLFDHARTRRLAFLNPAGAERWRALPLDNPIPADAEHAAEETGFLEALAEAGFVEMLTTEELARARLLAEAALHGRSLPDHLEHPTPRPTSGRSGAVTIQGDEPLVDHRQSSYHSRVATLGKLHSLELLLEAAECAGVLEQWIDMVTSLRETVGASGTTYVVKETSGQLAFELQWWRGSTSDDAAWDQTRAAISSCFDLALGRELPSDAVGLALDIPRTAAIGPSEGVELGVFCGVPGEPHAWGSIYTLGIDGLVLDGCYRYYDQPGEFSALLAHLESSGFAGSDSKSTLELLPPAVAPCTRIGAFHLRERERLLFNGIDIRQFATFLEDGGFPPSLVEYLDANAELFDHLRFDVSIAGATGAPGIVTSSFYGSI